MLTLMNIYYVPLGTHLSHDTQGTPPDGEHPADRNSFAHLATSGAELNTRLTIGAQPL